MSAPLDPVDQKLLQDLQCVRLDPDTEEDITQVLRAPRGRAEDVLNRLGHERATPILGAPRRVARAESINPSDEPHFIDLIA